MRKRLITGNVLAQIPHGIVEDGLGLPEIARKGTLRVRCSHYRIRLRRPADFRRPRNLSLSLPTDTRAGLQERAARLGTSESALVRKLIELIDKDDLYSAVLDNASFPNLESKSSIQ